jgi:ABC-2 type transport system ATP-binding protein
MKLPSLSSADAIISLAGVSRRFGEKKALDDVSLHVPRGCVFGLVGENGAGKTTLIKHILGLLRAQTGAVRVFGRDPVTNPAEVLARVGYLSEYRDLPPWMRIDELLRYTQAFYPGWDPQYAEALRNQFGLDPAARVKTLSQGQQAKAGLLIALAYRPPLLLLDEPSSGLDPVVRREILEAIIRTVADEGRTVFFSSHLLDEIERVADQLAMIHQGRIALCGRLDDIKQKHRRLVLRFAAPRTTPPRLERSLEVRGAGHEWTVLCHADSAEVRQEVSSLGAAILTDETPTLDEIFVAQATQHNGRQR